MPRIAGVEPSPSPRSSNPAFSSSTLPCTSVAAYGVTVWEILTGAVPYQDMRLTDVHQQVPKGLRPPRPAGIGLWTCVYDVRA